ncbi:MAG: DUF4965 domain-containing protein [Capsulimonadaceae bacterium]|nr:DUF4965 domain-containing protein [Capsulimonadaceae bacterium]
MQIGIFLRLSGWLHFAPLLFAVVLAAGTIAWAGPEPGAFRPPAVPLVTNDPYLSIWSPSDRLTDSQTRHWTKHPHPLISLIRIDGKVYRLMGTDPADTPAFPQTHLSVLPTRSIYDFDDGHVHVTLTFMAPALPNDLDALSRPLSYLTWDVRAVDGASHAVQIFDSTSVLLTVNTPDQPVVWTRETAGPLTALKAGTADQPLLTPAGDDTRIDWGYAYAAARSDQAQAAIASTSALTSAFTSGGGLPATDDTRQPRAASDDTPSLAFAFDLGKIGVKPVSRHLIVAYDEIYSIRWFGKKLRPYWRRNGAEPADMLAAAERDYASLDKRCAQFDKDIMADLVKAGGEKYAQIAALAFRQTFAGCGLVADANQQPLLLTKENTSNGDLATVDVIFPMDPIMVFFSPSLAKATLAPILAYAASDHWKFPCAPHDLGTYPIARGRDDGGEAMPVEESGNVLILCDAIAQSEGNADFVTPYWTQLTAWAKFLEQFGLDPENQLCTDDFMGHLAHNANLSVKAVLALAAYGDLCRIRGDKANAERYAELAKTDAAHWAEAAADDGRFRLAFDKPGTWSQKYNLVWDKILGLNVFPASVARSEVAFYKSQLQPYGVPLDSRTKLTKTDWSVWSASLADNQSDFEAIVSPIYDYLNETTARDPLADSYVTNNVHSGGMHARPVVGGLFIKMLTDRAIWKKWSSRDMVKAANWAPLPTPPVTVPVVPTSELQPRIWRYTTTAPPAGWNKPGFDDSSWAEGPGGFGTHGTPNAVIGTVWKTDDIWIRRTVTIPDGKFDNLAARVYHDEDIEVYIDGIPAASASSYDSQYVELDLTPKAQALLKPGATVLIAAHCRQTVGGQAVDVGIVELKEPDGK